jgi:hypothetical protein
VGAYAMERFQALWSETEKRARPKQTAGRRREGEPTTVKVAERVVVLHTDLPEEVVGRRRDGRIRPRAREEAVRVPAVDPRIRAVVSSRLRVVTETVRRVLRLVP